MKNISFLFLFLLTPILGCTGAGQDPFQSGAFSFPLHQGITVTVFWIGEPGSVENGFIPNIQSAWDDHWQDHYGGVDDPDSRNGFFPAAFIPQENPFYFALPYNDFDDSGNRKSDAFSTVYWSDEKSWGDLESMCKNRWIKVTKNGQTCYAQWEDVGPFLEDDAKYVFGTSAPGNTELAKAGLDLSPALRDCLKLGDVDQVDWQFVEEKDVPDGPWKQIITTRQISWD